MKYGLSVFIIIIGAAIVISPAFADTWALLVGIDDYQDDGITDLSFTVHDVTGFRDVLVDPAVCAVPRDNVYLMTNDSNGSSLPTHTNVLFRLENLTRRIKPEDTFIFYFSGHGMVRDGEHYLLSINSDPRSLTTLAVTAIPLQRVEQLLDQMGAHNILFILDSCRNDPEKGKGSGNNIMTDELSRSIIVKPRQQKGKLVGCVAKMFACSPGERAYEWPEKSSGAFSYYLIQGLRGEAADTRNQVTLRGLADYVTGQVRKWSMENGKQQVPWLDSNGPADADIVLASLPSKVVEIQTIATLRVQSVPPGATVYVDDVPLGKTPTIIPIDTGMNGEKSVNISVTHKGYMPKRGRVTLSVNRESSWNVVLDRKPRMQPIWSSLGLRPDKEMLYRSIIIPGLGQRYGGRHTSGTIFSAAALTSVAGAAIAHIMYSSSLDDYDESVARYRRADTSDAVTVAAQVMIDAHDDAKGKFRLRRVAYISVATVWASNIIHTLIVGPARPSTSPLVWNIVPGVASLGMSVRYSF